MVIQVVTHTEKKEAGSVIINVCKTMSMPEPFPFGSYRGFEMELSFDSFSREYKNTIINELRHATSPGSDIFGNIQRLDNTLSAFENCPACVAQLENTYAQLNNTEAEVKKAFSRRREAADQDQTAE